MTLHVDDFNRADGALGANWAVFGTNPGDDLHIVSGVVLQNSTTNGYAKWIGAGVWGRHQRTTVTLGPDMGDGVNSNSVYAGVYRDDAHGYYRFRARIGANSAYIEKRDQTGAGSQIGAGLSLAANLVEGDTLSLEVDDDGSGNNLLTAYVNGVQVAQETDLASTFSSGVPAIYVSGYGNNGITSFAAEDYVADVTPPVLSSPTASAATDTTATAGVTTDEAGGSLAWVTTATAATPSVAQIKAGQDSASASGAAGGSKAVVSTGAQSVSISGLTAGGTYYVHFVHTDAAGNDSNVVSTTSFTTSVTTRDVTFALASGTRLVGDNGLPLNASGLSWVFEESKEPVGANRSDSGTGLTVTDGEVTIPLPNTTLLEGAEGAFILYNPADDTSRRYIVTVG